MIFLDSLNSQIGHYAPLLIFVFAAFFLIIKLKGLAMLNALLEQIARLRDELLPLISGLTTRVADLTAQLQAANARIAELEAEAGNLPAAVDSLTQINDQLAGLVATA